jgi:chromosome segregation ATPase
MSDSFWKPEPQTHAVSRDRPQNAPQEPAALAVSADDFAALEDRIYRAVELVKQGREAGATAEARITEWEARAVRAEAQLQAQALVVEQIESELSVLREEREQVRQRMDRLLKQFDALEM